MSYYVNSGHKVVSMGKRFFAGDELPEKVVDLWGKGKDQLLEKKIIVERKPILHPVKDARTGSGLFPDMPHISMREDFSKKHLKKELEEKELKEQADAIREQKEKEKAETAKKEQEQEKKERELAVQKEQEQEKKERELAAQKEQEEREREEKSKKGLHNAKIPGQKGK